MSSVLQEEEVEVHWFAVYLEGLPATVAVYEYACQFFSVAMQH